MGGGGHGAFLCRLALPGLRPFFVTFVTFVVMMVCLVIDDRPAGRVLIFTGEGKGKTTAAFGAALRAAGHGQRVLVVQFAKGRRCGEAVAAAKLGDLIEVRLAGMRGFPGSAGARETLSRLAQEALARAAEDMAAGAFGLVVLDEAVYAAGQGLLEAEAVRQAVAGRADGVHVILTGRGPWEQFADLADTVTRMDCVKHAYRQGTSATEGIEF